MNNSIEMQQIYTEGWTCTQHEISITLGDQERQYSLTEPISINSDPIQIKST